MPQQLLTKSGQLSEVARHVVAPAGIVSTGWPAVRDTAAGFGVEFDPWQDGAGRLILAKRKDGSYAATVGGVVISIPRQVGKTFLIGAIVFALCLLHPGLTVIWTAHRLRTAGETFGAMQTFAKRAKVKPHIAKIVLGSGDEEIKFHNGSRILFGARERGFGRGWSDVDVLVFDEGQILTENAIDDMVPATNTAKNPIVLIMGTPPKPTDPSEFFARKRADALAAFEAHGESEDTAFIELSADPDASVRDREQWAKANPSYPHRTNDASMLRMLKMLTAESFVREGLGIWDEVAASVIDLAKWAKLEHVEDTRPTPVALSIEVSQDRKWANIGLAGMRSDGHRHVQIVRSNPNGAAHRGTGWVVARVKQLVNEWDPVAVALNPSGMAGSLVPDLIAADIEVVSLTAREMGQATGGFIDAVSEETIRHQGQSLLSMAVRAARTRQTADAKVWDLRGPIDIAPLSAASIALFALGKTPPKKKYRAAGF